MFLSADPPGSLGQEPSPFRRLKIGTVIIIRKELWVKIKLLLSTTELSVR